MTTLSKSLLQGATEALEYARGNKKKARAHHIDVPRQVDLKKIRTKLHLTRAEFARQYGFNLRTIEKWEQGVREPDTAARAYLTVIKAHPTIVIEALAQAALTKKKVV